MSDVERIILTATATILGGFIVFVAGQLTSRLVIERYEQGKVIGSIAEALLNYAPHFANSGEP